jgi:hypothetical protein
LRRIGSNSDERVRVLVGTELTITSGLMSNPFAARADECHDSDDRESSRSCGAFD